MQYAVASFILKKKIVTHARKHTSTSRNTTCLLLNIPPPPPTPIPRTLLGVSRAAPQTIRRKCTDFTRSKNKGHTSATGALRSPRSRYRISSQKLSTLPVNHHNTDTHTLMKFLTLNEQYAHTEYNSPFFFSPLFCLFHFTFFWIFFLYLDYVLFDWFIYSTSAPWILLFLPFPASTVRT